MTKEEREQVAVDLNGILGGRAGEFVSSSSRPGRHLDARRSQLKALIDYISDKVDAARA